MILKLALRETYRNWKLNLFFIINLSLGLSGFLTVDSFKTTIERFISENSKKILSADMSVSVRRQITSEELYHVRNSLGTDFQESQIIDFFAMLSTEAGSRLVMVKAVDSSYPFYGELELESGAVVDSRAMNKEIFTNPSAWVYPELKYQLNLIKGQKFKIGNLELTLDDFIKRDSSQTFRLTSLAPKIYINRDLLPQTGLIKFGSTFTHSVLFKLEESTDLAAKIDKIYSLIKDPAFKIDTPATAGEDSARQLNYLSDFLSLVALVALVLSAFGASYLFRLYLSKHLKEIAIYRSLGLLQADVVKIYFLQIVVLSILSIFPTVIFVTALLPLISGLIESLISFNIAPILSWSSVAVTLLISFLSTVVMTVPYLLKLNDIKPAQLFSEEKFNNVLKMANPVLFLPAFIFLYILSVWQSHSIYVGSIFFSALVGLSLILSLISFGLLHLFSYSYEKISWPFRLGLKSLSRKKNQSWSVFIAIAIGSLLINLLPQMKTTLKNDFSIQNESNLPSVFLFDIQDDQIAEIKNDLLQMKVELLNISALVRSRILKINDQDYERNFEPENFKTREDENAARFRNRGVNLSYRESLSDTEQIVAGNSPDEKYNPESIELPWASIEKRFAERVGINLGDILTFDVQGVEVKAKVASLRQVKWNSFRPNFFVLLQDGVINEAPKTFIAVLPQIPESQKNEIMTLLAKKYANVSAIDVRRTVNEIISVSEKMSWSLELMALLALFTGYVVLFSIIQTQVQSRRWELNMYKILGASFSEIRWVLVFEFTLISFLASLCGALLSIILSGILMKTMFAMTFIISWPEAIYSVILVTLVAGIVSLLSTRKIVNEKPLVLLVN